MTCSYTLRNNITLSAKAKALLTVPQTFVKGTYRIKERMPAEYPISVFFNKIQSPRASEMPLRVAQPAYDFEPEPDVDDYDAPNIFPYKKCSACGERCSCGNYTTDKQWLCEDCYEEEEEEEETFLDKILAIPVKSIGNVEKEEENLDSK